MSEQILNFLYVFLGAVAIVYWRQVYPFAALLALVWGFNAIVWGFENVPYIMGSALILMGILVSVKATNEARRAKEEQARLKEREEKQQAEQARLKEQKQREMDEDVHARPYTYMIGRHANETLAIRYGIANQEKKIKELKFPVFYTQSPIR